MESTLVSRLRAIAEGYEAARVREEMMATYAIPTRAAFLRILDAHYPPEEHERLKQQALVDGPAFVKDWNRQCTLEEWREYKEEEILRTETAVLWAVSMVERKQLPSNPRLATHVYWVQGFLEPKARRAPYEEEPPF